MAPPIRSVSPHDFRAVQTVELLKRNWLNPKTFEVHFTRPVDFEFKPGQTLRLMVDDLDRFYTPVSAPGADTLCLCIRHIPDGALTPLLATASVGTRFKVSGPHGYFAYQHCGRPSVFVATGNGIAPFVAMARAGAADFTLLHGVRGVEDLLYANLFKLQAATYVACLSGQDPSPTTRSGGHPPDPQRATHYRGTVREYIRHRLEPGAYDFYLCGREQMIHDVTHLVDEQFEGSRLFVEVFF